MVSNGRPSTVSVRGPTHSAFTRRSPNQQRTRFGEKQSVLVHRHVIGCRDLTGPLVFEADPVGVRGLQAIHEVPAHEVAAVVRAADARELAVGQRDRLQFLQQLDAARHDVSRHGRRRHGARGGHAHPAGLGAHLRLGLPVSHHHDHGRAGEHDDDHVREPAGAWHDVESLTNAADPRFEVRGSAFTLHT